MSGYLAVSVKLSHSLVAALVLTDGGYRLAGAEDYHIAVKQISFGYDLYIRESVALTARLKRPAHLIHLHLVSACRRRVHIIYADGIYQASPQELKPQKKSCAYISQGDYIDFDSRRF